MILFSQVHRFSEIYLNYLSIILYIYLNLNYILWYDLLKKKEEVGSTRDKGVQQRHVNVTKSLR